MIIYCNYRHSLQLQVVVFHPVMCFLKSSILSMSLILFGTVFHIRLPSKQSTWVPYVEVLVSGNFNNCLFRRSYQVFFKSKKYLMIRGLKLFVDLYISINNVWMLLTWTFHELSFSSRSSTFASCISSTKRRVPLCTLFI